MPSQTPAQIGTLNEAARLINEGRPAEALALLDRPATAPSPQLLSIRGVALAQLGRLDQALQSASRATQEAPDWAEGQSNFGQVLQAAGQLTEAEAAFARAVQLEPRHGVATLNLGCLVARAGRLPAAIELFSRAATLLPEHPAARYNWALALQQSGQPEAALAQFQAILQRHPDHAEAANQAAAILMAGLRHEEAVALLDRLIALQPRHARSYNNRGTALRALGRSAEALDSYRRAAALRPDHADAWRNLGLLAADQGLVEEAREAFRRALETKPDDPVARHMLDATEGRTTAAPPREYVARSFDAFADAFDSQLESLGYRVPAAMVELAEALRPGRGFERALDLGCGTGLVAAAFGPRVADWTGVDLSPRMLGRAAEGGAYARLAEADAVDFLAAAPGAYELVTAADMLIYLGDLAPLFAAVGRHLAPGGLFLCSIERNADGADRRLTSSGRYAHGDGYIERLAGLSNLTVLRALPTTLRQEHRLAVEGMLFALGPATG